MMRYDRLCEACGHLDEVVEAMDDNAPKPCPSCGDGEWRRHIGAAHVQSTSLRAPAGWSDGKIMWALDPSDPDYRCFSPEQAQRAHEKRGWTRHKYDESLAPRKLKKVKKSS